ncbi:MAG TPA: NB-ARC domain-containing protein [Candidatus Limnocylindrales bacterium]|nr:NB-ARC domain-containing protein [Candidatus Limnocylindrales bacterium]
MAEPTPQVDASQAMGLVVGDDAQQYNTFNIVTPAAPVVWPVWVGSAPPLADCFQARAEGDRLADWTDDSGTVVLTQVLSGLGGVGKSQLAAQLVARRWHTRSVDLLVWVAASNRSAIIAGFAQAAQQVGIAGPHEGELAAARLLPWLAATERRWLVILDDVNDPADLHDWWPPASPAGTTVVTTRRRDAAFSGHGRRRIEVGLFTMAEATAYLKAKLAAHPDLADDVAGVAADLGRLPLALAQAAAYLLDEEIPCSRYRQLFADHTRQLAALVPEPTSLPDSHQHTVDVTCGCWEPTTPTP